MSPLVAYHATFRNKRDSIMASGLISRRGVYVFDFTGEWTHFTTARQGTFWTSGMDSDVWQVVYVGPLALDPLVNNGIVLRDSVGAEHVTLVTRNSNCTRY